MPSPPTNFHYENALLLSNFVAGCKALIDTVSEISDCKEGSRQDCEGGFSAGWWGGRPARLQQIGLSRRALLLEGRHLHQPQHQRPASIYLSIYPSIYLSIYLSIYIYMYIYMYIYVHIVYKYIFAYIYICRTTYIGGGSPASLSPSSCWCSTALFTCARL